MTFSALSSLNCNRSEYSSSSSRRVSDPTSSINAETRSDLPMWWTYNTRTTTLMTTRTYATTTASPGTDPPLSNWTSRSEIIACTNVAMNRPTAIWLGLSRRNVCTMRGEN